MPLCIVGLSIYFSMTNEAHCLLVRPLMEYLSPVHAVQQCRTRLPALYFVLDSKAQAGCYDMTMILTSRYLSPNDCNIVVKHGHQAHSSHFVHVFWCFSAACCVFLVGALQQVLPSTAQTVATFETVTWSILVEQCFSCMQYFSPSIPVETVSEMNDKVPRTQTFLY